MASPPSPGSAAHSYNPFAPDELLSNDQLVEFDDDGGGDEYESNGVEYEPLSDDQLAELNDSDNDNDSDNGEEDETDGEEDGTRKVKDGDEEEESDNEEDEPLKVRVDEAESSNRGSLPLVAGILLVEDGEFRRQFAAVENTAGFMRIATAEAGTGSQGGKEIVVLYRYTRFSRTWSGRRGVEACRRTKLHWLRYLVPPAANMVPSLALAGASLCKLIYPGLFHRQLRGLCSKLAAPMINTIPQQATRLQVIMDVGILRPEDYTRERMDYMPLALEAKMQEPWPEYYHFGLELHLPEPVLLEEEEERGKSTRPAKRRRITEEKEIKEEQVECCICFEPLKTQVLAWPGCRHLFHGECVENQLALVNEMCPLCRHKLSDLPSVE